MNTKLFKMLNDTLAYATFKDADVEKQYKRLLVVTDSELNEAGFEENQPIEDAMDELQVSIDDADPIEEEDDNDTESTDDDENEDEDEDEDDDDEEDEEIDEEEDDED